MEIRKNKIVIFVFLIATIAIAFNNATTPVNASGTSTRHKIVTYAESMIGEHYLFGTEGQLATYSPFTDTTYTCRGRQTVLGYKESCLDHFHIDCSGLVYAAAHDSGLTVPRTTAAGYYSTYSDAINVNTLQPGDLVFLQNTYKTGISHIGWYVGNNAIVEAKGTDYGVVAAKLDDWINGGNWAGARRIKAQYWPNSDNSYDGSDLSTLSIKQVTASALNVRDGFSTAHSVVGQVHSGERYIAMMTYNGWVKIFFDDQVGWFSISYAVDADLTDVVEITASALNVRSGPGSTYSTVGQAKYYERFVVLGISGSWYNINFGGQSAWIHGGYVRLIEASSDELDSGVPVSSSLSATGETETWRIIVDAGMSSMHTVLTCGSQDFDVYGKLGSAPTTSSYDWRGYTSGGEDVTFSNPGAGEWFIMVRSYSGSGAYELTVTLEATPTVDYTFNGYCGADQWYNVYLYAGLQIDISLSWSGGTDLDWFLYKSSDTSNYVARGYTVNNPEAGSYTPSTEGWYKVRVNKYSGSDVSFTLTVES